MKKKVCVIFNNFGPYHISRIKSLNDLYEGEVFPIQLAPLEKLREWRVDNLPMQLLTVQDKPLEEALESQICDQLVILLNQLKPGAVVIAGYSEPAMRSAVIWGRKNKALTVLMSDSHYLDKSRIWLKEKIKGWWITKHFDAAFVSGSRASKYLEGLGFPRNFIWLGYDVVDNNYFIQKTIETTKVKEEICNKLGLPERYFLYVGRLSPEKNLIRLLDAYSLYRGKINKNPWGLVIVGSGSQEEELKNHADKIGLNDIVWPGFKQYHELPHYYALASCFILLSISEPWGLVVNEAMACGLPILVSERCGCVPDLVFPGINGYTFDPNSVDDMAFYMERISSEDVDIESMKEASVKIVSNYNPETWAKALTDCMQVTMSRKYKQ